MDNQPLLLPSKPTFMIDDENGRNSKTNFLKHQHQKPFLIKDFPIDDGRLYVLRSSDTVSAVSWGVAPGKCGKLMPCCLGRRDLGVALLPSGFLHGRHVIVEEVKILNHTHQNSNNDSSNAENTNNNNNNNNNNSKNTKAEFIDLNPQGTYVSFQFEFSEEEAGRDSYGNLKRGCLMVVPLDDEGKKFQLKSREMEDYTKNWTFSKKEELMKEFSSSSSNHQDQDERQQFNPYKFVDCYSAFRLHPSRRVREIELDKKGVRLDSVAKRMIQRRRKKQERQASSLEMMKIQKKRQEAEDEKQQQNNTNLMLASPSPMTTSAGTTARNTMNVFLSAATSNTNTDQGGNNNNNSSANQHHQQGAASSSSVFLSPNSTSRNTMMMNQNSNNQKTVTNMSDFNDLEIVVDENEQVMNSYNLNSANFINSNDDNDLDNDLFRDYDDEFLNDEDGGAEIEIEPMIQNFHGKEKDKSLRWKWAMNADISIVTKDPGADDDPSYVFLLRPRAPHVVTDFLIGMDKDDDIYVKYDGGSNNTNNKNQHFTNIVTTTNNDNTRRSRSASQYVTSTSTSPQTTQRRLRSSSAAVLSSSHHTNHSSYAALSSAHSTSNNLALIPNNNNNNNFQFEGDRYGVGNDRLIDEQQQKENRIATWMNNKFQDRRSCRVLQRTGKEECSPLKPISTSSAFDGTIAKKKKKYEPSFDTKDCPIQHDFEVSLVSKYIQFFGLITQVVALTSTIMLAVGSGSSAHSADETLLDSVDEEPLASVALRYVLYLFLVGSYVVLWLVHNQFYTSLLFNFLLQRGYVMEITADVVSWKHLFYKGWIWYFFFVGVYFAIGFSYFGFYRRGQLGSLWVFFVNSALFYFDLIKQFRSPFDQQLMPLTTFIKSFDSGLLTETAIRRASLYLKRCAPVLACVSLANPTSYVYLAQSPHGLKCCWSCGKFARRVTFLIIGCVGLGATVFALTQLRLWLSEQNFDDMNTCISRCVNIMPKNFVLNDNDDNNNNSTQISDDVCSNCMCLCAKTLNSFSHGLVDVCLNGMKSSIVASFNTSSNNNNNNNTMFEIVCIPENTCLGGWNVCRN